MKIKPNFSRRDFLKVMLTSLGAFLASCFPEVEETEAPPTEMPLTDPPPTEIPETETPPEPTEPPQTEAPATEELDCMQLISPEDGATLATIGKVVFSWQPAEDAEKYEIEFILPTGQPVTFEALETAHTRYLESFPLSGEFIWKVTALDLKGNVVCVSEPFTFTKLAPVQDQNDGGDGGTGDGINIQDFEVQ